MYRCPIQSPVFFPIMRCFFLRSVHWKIPVHPIKPYQFTHLRGVRDLYTPGEWGKYLVFCQAVLTRMVDFLVQLVPAPHTSPSKIPFLFTNTAMKQRFSSLDVKVPLNLPRRRYPLTSPGHHAGIGVRVCQPPGVQHLRPVLGTLNPFPYCHRRISS